MTYPEVGALRELLAPFARRATSPSPTALPLLPHGINGNTRAAGFSHRIIFHQHSRIAASRTLHASRIAKREVSTIPTGHAAISTYHARYFCAAITLMLHML